MAKLTGPNGKVYDFPDENAPAAAQQGFRPSTPEEISRSEIGGAVGQATSAALGAARAATMGGSDQALTEFGVKPETLKDYRDINPTASTSGEVGGTLASLLVAPEVSGPGLAAKAGNAASKLVKGGGFLSKLAGKALGGAVEGGIYGLGQFVSEDAIDNHPLTAQKLLASMAGGALVNGGLSGAGFAVGSGLKKGGSKLVQYVGGGGLKSALEDFAEKTVVSQYGIKSDLKKWGVINDINEIGRYGLNRKVSLPGGGVEPLFKMGDKADNVFAKAQIVSEEEGAKIGAALTQVDAAVQPGSFHFDTGALRAKVEADILAPLRKDPFMAPTVKAIEDAFDGPGGFQNQAYTFEEAWATQSRLRRKLGALVTASDSPIIEAKDDLRRLMRDEIIEQAETLVPGAKDALKQASRDYRSAQNIERIAESQMLREQGNRGIGMSSHQIGQAVGLAGAALTGSPFGMLAGVGAAVANQTLLERGGTIAAVAADRFAKSGAIPRMAKGLHTLFNSQLTSNPAFGGAFRAMLTRAAAKGAGELLATHVQLAKTQPDYLGAVGMPDEDPASVNDFAVKADQMDGLHAAVEAQDAKIDQAIGRFLGQQPGAAPALARGDRRGSFKQDSDRLARMAADPASLMEELVPHELAAAAPALAAMVGADAMKATQFLHAVAPKNPNPEPMKALGDDDWEPSDRELERFGRYVDAVERPDLVLAELKTGEVTPEGVEAFRVVYPELLSDIQARMMSRLAAYDKPLTYKQKAALSTLFGTPMGGAGDPDRVALIQEAHATTMSAQEQSGPKQQSGNREVSVAKNLATQTQRIEERGQA